MKNSFYNFLNIKKSISKRIFLITFLLITLLLGFSMLFQVYFFQSFYQDRKSNNLEKAVNKFKALYSLDIKNSSTLYKALGYFEVKNNAKIAIYSTNGNVQYISDQEGPKSENVKLLNQIFNNLYQNKDYTQALIQSDKSTITTVDNTQYSIKHIVCLTPFSLNERNDSIIIAISSFQNIEEASQIIGEFYKYVIIGVILLGFILSLIYSNLISKPLKRINRTAEKMSSMNFNEKCAVEREDEIGSLAKTLNFLSQNLSNALSDLKEKNKKLELDIEKERQLEKLRKDFIAGVSHELKTPIGIIEGYAEGLKDNVVEGESREIYLDIIIDEAKKMDSLVMDMLELSKLEAGKTKLDITTFDLKELFEKVALKNQVDISTNNLTIIRNFSLDNYPVLGDSFKIEQVLTNLLTNAIKYTNNGEKIIIDIIEKKGNLYFSIENTGAFIPDNELPNIWSQFYKIDKARNRSARSTGLGLAIVKNLLTLHNSDFGVMNTKEGVKFYFSLSKAPFNG